MPGHQCSRQGGGGSPASEADSGEKWLASFAKYDRATSSWKIPQCSLLGDSTAFSGTWPKQGMMRRGGCSAQPTLEPLISESASGSLLPTPTAQQYGTRNNGHRPDGSTYKTAGSPSLATMARRGEWPMIPTPTAMDHRDMSVEAVDYARTNSQQVRLAGFVRTMIPTPTVGDSRSSGSRNAPGSKAHAGVSLTDFVRDDGGKGRPTSPHTGGSLNPTWVEWLMGWPLGWTDLRPLETGKFLSWQQKHGVSSCEDWSDDSCSD